jgi:hypothetical protein
MPPKERTREEAIKQSEHVLYEIQMFASLHTHFQNGDHDRAVANLPLNGLAARNALIESFQIHARQLIDFLTDRPNRKEATASDFTVAEWSISTSDRRALKRLSGEFSQRVAHLSWRRSELDATQQRVIADGIFDAVRRQLLVFVECIDHERVRPRFFEDVLEMMFGQVIMPEHPRYSMPRADPEVPLAGTHPGSVATSSLRPPPLHGSAT